jgi:hypothetical protein
MPIIKLPEDVWGPGFDQLVPGSRVEYQGASWKVVGMYFASGSETAPRRTGRSIELDGSERTKYLILQSLQLGPNALQYLGTLRSS